MKIREKTILDLLSWSVVISFILLLITVALTVSGCGSEEELPSYPELSVENSSEEAIFGGTPFPELAIEKTGTAMIGGCTANFITNRWLLTAGHCINPYNPPSLIRVTYGTQIGNVISFFHHPDFNYAACVAWAVNTDNCDADVLLVKTDTSFKIYKSDGTEYLNYLRQFYSGSSSDLEGRFLYHLGYGKENIAGGFGTLRTQFVRPNTIYPNWIRFVPEGTTVAHRGDSGAAYLIPQNLSQSATRVAAPEQSIAGITSFGMTPLGTTNTFLGFEEETIIQDSWAVTSERIRSWVQSTLEYSVPSARTDFSNKITSLPEGPWGDWQYAIWCPKDQWAYGFQLKTERPQGSSRDDTGVNEVALFCRNRDGTRNSKITSNNSNWGTWGVTNYCSSREWLTGFEKRLEPPQGSGADDTGMTDLNMFCKAPRPSRATLLRSNNGVPWGNWSLATHCGEEKKICGMKTKIESSQGNGDDSAMNDIQFYCCSE